jgi:D-alanyl-lipoteichoic acid acyltransferase DltB (MBOAT superfamily)
MLAASYYFYMSWNAKYVFLILFTTIISYAAAILLEKTERLRNKKIILIGTAVACLGVLFFFKYFNFVSESVTAVFRLFAIQMNPVLLNLLLPVGISFYTFQTLSYVIDVYKGDVKAEHHFGYYAAFISFFPQLVAGPIERTNNLLPQIKAEHKFDYDQATYGLKLMAWGYFKKIVIADTLSQFVSKVYDAPQGFSGFALVLATVFFTLQIYCDFSGYSDIAIGTAKLLGINLMTNFKSPYFSQSIKEFWSRWHISLSTWFKDYIYIPLGGSRKGFRKKLINLTIIFLISGLWHGAAWTFVIWGFLHAIYRILEEIIDKCKKVQLTINNFLLKKIVIVLNTIVIFALVNFSWIFFRANSINDAFYVIKNLFGQFDIYSVYEKINYLIQTSLLDKYLFSKFFIIVIFISIIYLFVEDFIMKKNNCNISSYYQKLRKGRYIIYIVQALLIIIIWLIFSAVYGQSGQFIYFQF